MGVRVKVIPALKARDARYAYEATDDYVKIAVGKTSGKHDGDVGKVSENVGKTAKSVWKASGKREKVSGKILEACRERNSITIPELASLIGITERSIERNIQKLQRNGLLERVGGRKEGYWEVKENG
jgi:ATP-dependent DNA helicase RecG